MRLIGFLLILVLAGCGGPAYNSRVHHTPQNSHMKGWQKPYTVNGRTYYPLATASGYSQKGVASWYGPDFHGKKTSNGETYDMHRMTAAHKTLPMGAMVRVENLDTGKSAVVRVNDRGPFVDDRVIDLSYAAATKLGVVGPGTARVRVTAIGDGEHSAAEVEDVAAAQPTGFSVQIGSFSQMENARQLSREVQPVFGSSRVSEVNVEGRTYYRVLAGYFPLRHNAESARERLLSLGYSGSRVIILD